MDKWDKRFLELAAHVAGWSKDPSTKVGAVIARKNSVISMGYNGFPACVPDHEDWLNDRPIKYQYVIHAETNAILNAGREGRDIRGTTLYLSPLPPCCECAKLIMAAGIIRVVAKVGLISDGSAFDNFTKTEDMFEAGGLAYDWH